MAHVREACADPLVVPLGTLRAEKTPETTLQAMEKGAHGLEVTGIRR
jgi:hypothetical protein